MRCAAGLIALSLFFPGIAAAATVTLKPVSPPGSYRPGGQPVDVLGITPGMAPDTVREILAKQYGNVVVTQNNLGLENRGVVVQTQNFVTQMTAQNDTDQAVVWFGTPTTGNGAVEVTRQLSYRDETSAPPMQEARAALIARYGKPAFDGSATGNGEVQLLAWSYHGNTPSPCPRSSCRMGLSEGLEVTNLPAYARAVKTGNDLTIVVTLLSGIADPSKASGMVVTMSDAATKLHSLEAAIAQMKGATGDKTAKKPEE